MKFTNVKQLIIKFMGGGLINFPTRFLRWVKINGDTDDSDDGGGDDSGGGESGDMTLAEAWSKTFDLNHNAYGSNDDDVIVKVETPLPLMVLCLNTEGYIEEIGERVFEPIGRFQSYIDLSSEENIKVVPFEEIEYDDNYNTYLFLYDLNVNVDVMNHSYIYINDRFYIKADGQSNDNWCYKYNDNYYVAYHYGE